jgi:predicted nuclease of restriction endonuclease-like (RecB) superfamily
MSFELDKDYGNVLQLLKEKIRQARLKAAIAVNKELLSVYWEIGNTILQQQKKEGWGTKVIDRLILDLKTEFPDMKGLSPRNIKYMRAFAEAYPSFAIVQDPVAQLQIAENEPETKVQAKPAQINIAPQTAKVQVSLAQLSWYHHTTLLDKIKDQAIRNFYIQKAVENGWSRDIMVHQIESRLHERQGALSNNFNLTLPAYDSELAMQLFKDPYQLDFIMLGEEAKERDLEDALMNHITKLLLELGDGFAFMGRQKRFEAGGKEFFIDLLFYNTKLRRHIIIDLKIGEFEAEFVSKMNLYLGIADDTLKGEYDNPAIGLILCKTKNKIVAEYALRDTSKPIGIAEYKIAEKLPDDIKGELPSIEEIETRLDEELKEQQNPVDARLKAIKDKLKNIQADEIQTPATYNILKGLYSNGLKPLYKELIEKFASFEEDFHSKTFSWSGTNKHITTFEQLDEFWNAEENLKNTSHVDFNYALHGLKKAGTENCSVHLGLNFVMDTYWYGFVLVNHNNQQPFLKNLYHQPITANDKQKIIELLMTKAMDDIDWNLERIKNSK